MAKNSNNTHHFQNIYILLIMVVKDSSCEFSTAVLSDYYSKNSGELQYYEHGVRTGRLITFLLITKVNKFAKTRHNNTFMFL